MYNAVIGGRDRSCSASWSSSSAGRHERQLLLWLLFASRSSLGVSVVLPIGGADMPVVIAILNSLTGLAAALTGFVLDNQALVDRRRARRRLRLVPDAAHGQGHEPLVANVLFGSWGAAAAGGAAAGGGEQLPIRETTADDVAVPLAYAQKVIIVPGYGLAVAQAQHAVRELADVLQERGVDVKYAIHPVAGRMPGHMNVLLAEANVPYDDLYEMEQINDDFAQDRRRPRDRRQRRDQPGRARRPEPARSTACRSSTSTRRRTSSSSSGA